MFRAGEWYNLGQRPTHRVGSLAREWLALEVFGHGGLILLRQLCGTWWSWGTGGPFASIDVSRAMLQGDAFWVLAVVCTSAIRRGLIAEWGYQLRQRRAFGAFAWLPWLLPGCILGWIALIRGDQGASYILALPHGRIFEGYHILFFGYVAARVAACVLQLAAATRLIASRVRRALATDGPRPYLPLGVAAIAGVAVLCAMIYLHIYQQGGSIQAEWHWFAPEQV